MKKIWLVVFAVMLFFSGAYAQDKAAEETFTIEERTYTFYNGYISDTLTDPFPLYFMNGVYDLPYVELESWMELMIFISRDWAADTGYDLIFNAEGPDAAYVRENEYHMQFDFDKNTILFDDYNAFMHSSAEGSLLDNLSASGFSQAGESELFQRNMNMTYDRYGDELLLDLGAYHIDLIMQDGKYYVPLQTMNDLMIAPYIRAVILFNGECLMIINGGMFGNVRDGLTELGELYYSAGTGERSPELTQFGYNELCFMMDNLYGLKGPHEITGFDRFFHQMAYDEEFFKTDAANADETLHKVIDYYLDDMHSDFIAYSYLTGEKEVQWLSGPGSQKYNEAAYIYAKAREPFYDEGYFDDKLDGIVGYEEIGNTAYVTIDTFACAPAYVYYDAAENNEELPMDTIGIVIRAHSMIYRPDSPIENVVIDLSNNPGGQVDAAIFLIAWVLGDAQISVKDTFTGAMSTTAYRADVNLDRQFNPGDVVDDKNIYVLISPKSFSCGNLVPAAFKASDKVTVLGRTSGGGSCLVQPVSTAWGTFFQISGSSRLSFLKNGSFYDIDQGVTPDYTISKPQNFYDHEKLTEYINNLY